MKRRLAWILGTWFGCGMVPRAPGTAGSIGSLPLYFLLHWWRGPWAVFIGAIAITAIGIWAAEVVAQDTKKKDPQVVVIDEVAGMLFSLTLCPNDWRWVLAGFVAFRIFDSTKPWPINVLESRLPGGWGIVLDDVGAGAWVAALFAALRYAGVFS